MDSTRRAYRRLGTWAWGLSRCKYALLVGVTTALAAVAVTFAVGEPGYAFVIGLGFASTVSTTGSIRIGKRSETLPLCAGRGSEQLTGRSFPTRSGVSLAPAFGHPSSFRANAYRPTRSDVTVQTANTATSNQSLAWSAFRALASGCGIFSYWSVIWLKTTSATPP